MKPRFNIGQRVTVSKSAQSGTVQSLVSGIQGTYVYRVRFPGGAEYSYAEWELAKVERVNSEESRPTQAV